MSIVVGFKSLRFSRLLVPRVKELSEGPLPENTLAEDVSRPTAPNASEPPQNLLSQVPETETSKSVKTPEVPSSNAPSINKSTDKPTTQKPQKLDSETPKPKIRPTPIKYSPNARNISYEMFGNELLDRDYDQLSGGVPDAQKTVVANTKSGYLAIRAQSDKFESHLKIQKAEDGSLTCRYMRIKVDKDDRNSVLAPTILGRQLSTLFRLGIRHVYATAARIDSEGVIGYKVWPKMGFDGPIPLRTKYKLPEQFASAQTVQQLYSMPGGRKWWEEFGESFQAHMDLTSPAGKKTRDTIDYMLTRAARGQKSLSNNWITLEEITKSFGTLKRKSLPEPEEHQEESEDEIEPDFLDEHSKPSPRPTPKQVTPSQAPSVSQTPKPEETYHGHKVGDRVYSTGTRGEKLPGTIINLHKARHSGQWQHNAAEVEHDNGDYAYYPHDQIKPHVDEESEDTSHIPEHEKETHLAARKLIGKDWTHESAGRLVGAPEGVTPHAVMGMVYENGGASLHVKFGNQEIEGDRTLWTTAEGRKYCENHYTKVHVDGKKIGMDSLYKQVRELGEKGYEDIKNNSVNSPPIFNPDGSLKYKGMNGGYTWASYGYDTRVSQLSNAKKVKEAFPDAEYLSDLMLTEEGRKWWKANSVSFAGTFTIKPNPDGTPSRSMMIMKMNEDKLAKLAREGENARGG